MRPSLAQQKAIVGRVRRMVRVCNKSYIWKSNLPLTGLSDVTSSSKSYIVRLIWLVIILVCFFLCIYQCYNRLRFFRTQPVAVDIAFKEYVHLEPPTMTVCSQETEELGVLSRQCQNYTAGPLGSFNLMYKLLHCASKIGMDYEKLWKILNTTKMVTFVGTTDANGKGIPLNYISTEEYLGSGICNRIQMGAVSKKQLKWLKDNGMIIKVGCFIDKCSGAVMGTIQRTRNPTDMRKGWGFMMQNEVMGSVSTKEFTFINRRQQPCINDVSHFKCHKECILQRYKEKFDCRFPHYPREMQAPECEGENATKLYSTSLLLRLQTDSVTSCKCTRRCSNEDIEGYMYVEGATNNGTVISIKMSDRFMTAFEERIAYDFTAFLCEIGGNLGLNLGLSILSAVDLCYLLLRKFITKGEFMREDPLFKKVIREFSKMDELRGNYYTWNECNIAAVLKFVVLLACTIASCWFVYVRTRYFYSHPTRMIVQAAENHTILFPQIVVCSETQRFGSAKLKIARKMRRLSDCPSLNIKLLDALGRFKSNVTNLWVSSSNVDNFLTQEDVERLIPTNIILKNVTEDFVLLPEGNCSAFSIGSRLYLGTTNVFMLINLVNKNNLGCRKDHTVVYFYPTNDPVDLKTFFHNPIGTAMVVMFAVKQVRLLNTPRNPCVSTAEYHTCTTRCQQRLMHKLINCSLPYMTQSLLTSCETTTSAKAADMAYQIIFTSMDPVIDCQCIRRCNQTIYSMSSYFEFMTQKPVSILAFSFYSNMIITFNEQVAYSFIALICDVGGNLGLTLGLSLLSVFSMIQTALTSSFRIIQRCA